MIFSFTFLLLKKYWILRLIAIKQALSSTQQYNGKWISDWYNIAPSGGPRVKGLGPVAAIRKALQRANLTLDDMDVIEINEAFAVQVLGCLKELNVAFDDSRVNPNGGAIAVGHPLGASGVRLALTVLHQLERQQGRYAVVSLCIGVGQGVAMILERELA